MALIGYLMRVIDDTLDLRENPHAALLMVLVFPLLASPEGDIAGVLPGLPAVVLLWLAAVRVTFRRRGATHPLAG